MAVGEPASNPEAPKPEVPQPPVPPDMQPIVPETDPQPGRGGDGQPPPIIA